MSKFFKTVTLLTTIALVVSACGDDKTGDDKGKTGEAEQADFSAKVIYGDDDRLDLYQVQDRRLLQAADATVALILSSDLRQVGDQMEIATTNFGTSYSPPLCNDERFREQDTAAFCSGFLVGPNLVATAGHCIRTQGTSFSDCETTSFVFGFALKRPTDKPRKVAAKEVYKCKSIVKSVLTTNGADFAIVELDRPVEGHTPLKMRRSGNANVNDPLVVIGYPSGLPVKVAGGATVRKVEKSHYVASLDTYGGNSGSAVFNANTMQVEGVLVRGEEDFVKRGSCQVSNRCSQAGCRGEDVTRISEALPYIPNEDDDSGDPGSFPGDSAKFGVTPNVKIPDNFKSGVSSSLIADRAPNGKAIFVDVNITHPWRGDLILTLTAPDGSTYVLSNRQGRSQDHIIGVYGDDLQSRDPLVKASHVKRAGEWKLTVSDNSARDTGVLKSWGLRW